MKKLYYLLAGIAMILVTIVACEKASIGVDEMQTLQKQDVAAKPDGKVSICHYDNILDEYFHINISSNSLDKHLANHQYDAAGVQITDENYDGTPANKDSTTDFSVVEGGNGINVPFFVDDFDGDGIADCADCNDDTLNPNGNSEKTIWYEDKDHDGYGSKEAGEFIKSCEDRTEFGVWYSLNSTDDCDNWFNYSPEGTYKIYKENAIKCLVNSVLTEVKIELIDTEYIITGNGFNRKQEALDFYGKAFVDDINHTVKLFIYKKNVPNNGTFTEDEKTELEGHFIDGEKNYTFFSGLKVYRDNIGGVLSVCDGIVEELSDLNTTGNIWDYSFEPFDANPNLVDNDSDGYTECEGDCDDNNANLYPFSPYGTYTIYRDNGAFLNITVFSDGTITGEGETGNAVEVVYDGTWTSSEETILMIIPQFRKDNGDAHGTHYIGGSISECGGIINDFTDKRCSDSSYSGYNNCPDNLGVYSFNEF